MHLDSPDKRPTEYGQNFKEFIKQEKLLIAVSTLQIVQEILAVPELIIISLWAVSILKESSSRQSIGVTHCYPSIIEWSRTWAGSWLAAPQPANIAHQAPRVSPPVSQRYVSQVHLLPCLTSTLHPRSALDNFSEIKRFSFAAGELRVSMIVFLN